MELKLPSRRHFYWSKKSMRKTLNLGQRRALSRKFYWLFDRKRPTNVRHTMNESVDVFVANDAARLTTAFASASDRGVKQLLAMTSNKIRYFATMGHNHTVFRVPSWMPESPMIDQDQTSKTLAQILRGAGYIVLELEDHVLFIAWHVV